jgi:hypothetical protein
MRRDSVFQTDEPPEPRELLSGEVNDLRGTIAPGNRSGNTNEQDVDEFVSLGTIDARIIDCGKRLRENTSWHAKTSVRK